MKKITFYVAMAAMVLLSSCSMITGSEIDTEETVNSLKELVKENVTDKGMRVIELTIMPQEALTNKPDLITLLVADKKNSFRRITLLKGLKDYDVTKDEEVDTTDALKFKNHKNAESVATLEVDKLPADVIKKQVEDAKTQIPEGYDFKGVGSYKITVLSGKPVTTFKIQVTENGNSTKVTGRRIQTTYYELDCTVDDAGKTTVKLDD